jgi:hypothetical protein
MKLDILSVAVLAMLPGSAVAQDVSIRCYHRPECCTNLFAFHGRRGSTHISVGSDSYWLPVVLDTTRIM